MIRKGTRHTRQPILLLAILLIFSLSPIESKAAEKFCVVDELVPILEEPGGEYTIEDGCVDGDRVLGIAVYGNHIEVKPITEKPFGDTWAELLDPDGGKTLGFIEKKGLEPLLPYEPIPPTASIIRTEAPDLLLQPGAADDKYRLSNWNYSLLKGEAVTAFGRFFKGDTEWLLLGFSTSAEVDGEGGVGMRYAWARSRDLMPLAGYKPNYAENEDVWMPAGMRQSAAQHYSEGHGERFQAVQKFPDTLKAALLEHGFGIDPKPLIPEYIAVDDMCDLYSGTGSYTVDFITTDLFLHSYHLIFSRMLQKFEHVHFAPALGKSLSSALANLEQAASIPGELRDSKADALDMLTIPLFLLGERDASGLSERAIGEARRIMAAEGKGVSQITGTNEDYTQYRPRGHYAGIPEQESYFRAVSFLGNAGLPLFTEEGAPLCKNVAAAALLVMALDSAGDLWTSFDEPINFLVGTPDDGSFKLYRNIVRKRIGTLENAQLLKDERVLASLAEEIRGKIETPRIRNRETGNISKEEEAATRRPEFRISSKRFTFDAYIMNSLTSPRVGSDEMPRNIPEGTDVMAVLGSSAADEYAGRNNRIEHYEENMARLKDEIKAFTTSDDTAYTSWLGVLRAGFGNSGSRQFFYRSPLWQWKKLLTCSASWAELKHDTVLYAKQSGAEIGGGGEWRAGEFAPPMPRGYVDPDPQTFAAIASALDRLSLLMERFALDDDLEYRTKIERFRGLCSTAMGIAEREVRDEILSADDYNDIKALARAFTAPLLMPGGVESYEQEKLRMAVVTDVATDFMGGTALHVGVGVPRAVRVFVNDRSGGPRIAKGYVYSYYEFEHPLSDGRITDGEWKKIVYDRENPDSPAYLKKLHPAWYEKFDAK